MRVWYMQKLLKYLNLNFKSYSHDGTTIWVMKDKAIALFDNDGLEIIWEFFKEGVLKP